MRIRLFRCYAGHCLMRCCRFDAEEYCYCLLRMICRHCMNYAAIVYAAHSGVHTLTPERHYLRVLLQRCAYYAMPSRSSSTRRRKCPRHCGSSFYAFHSRRLMAFNCLPPSISRFHCNLPPRMSLFYTRFHAMPRQPFDADYRYTY